jgi:hypothetical protein
LQFEILPVDVAAYKPLYDECGAVVCKYLVHTPEQIEGDLELVFVAVAHQFWQQEILFENYVFYGEPIAELAMFNDFLVGNNLIVKCLK